MSRREKKEKPDKQAEEKTQPDKPSYVQKMSDRARVVGALSETLVKEPKAFPRKTAHAFRPWIRKVWNARGGGLYACGFVLTFVYLEASTLIDEILSATGVVSFFTEQLVEFLFRFIGESLRNVVMAFIWPVAFLQYSPPWGIAILAAIYVIFARYIKKPLERWLFHDGD